MIFFFYFATNSLISFGSPFSFSKSEGALLSWMNVCSRFSVVTISSSSSLWGSAAILDTFLDGGRPCPNWRWSSSAESAVVAESARGGELSRFRVELREGPNSSWGRTNNNVRVAANRQKSRPSRHIEGNPGHPEILIINISAAIPQYPRKSRSSRQRATSYIIRAIFLIITVSVVP